MSKVAFICGTGFDTFIRKTLEKLTEFETHLFVVSSKNEIGDAIDWSDIVWFEFANEVAAVGTKMPAAASKKVVVRLRSYELFNQLYKKIHWENVDELIFTAPHVKTLLEQFHPEIRRVKTDCVPNGFDVDAIPDFGRFRGGYNIAYVPNLIDHRKNPALMLQVMRTLVDTIPQFKLFIAGRYRDLRYYTYLAYMIREMGLTENVIYQGYVNDMEEFWRDKTFLLSTSVFESFGNNIFEAMLHNLVPVVHNFYGARTLYPIESVYNIPQEARQIFLDGSLNVRDYRQWVIDKGYTMNNHIAQVTRILKSLEESR